MFVARRRKSLPDVVDPRWEKRFPAACALLVATTAFVGALAKLSQANALTLGAQDFWLFVDMLRGMEAGVPFVTRFAPQAIGYVQHGAVHAFFGWYLALPLTWLAGPFAAALLFGPLMLSAATGVLALALRPAAGAQTALIAAGLFWLCSPAGKILMYDVHPEAAYPLAVFAWAWAAGWFVPMNAHETESADHPDQPPAPLSFARGVGVALLTLAGMSIKEDGFLVFLPLALWLAIRPSRGAVVAHRRASGWITLTAVVAGTAWQFHSLHQWASGNWGPAHWQGLPVQIAAGPDLFHGIHWDSPESAGRILSAILDSEGGPRAVAGDLARFLVSRAWLSLLFLVPWVIPRLGFWVCILPLAGTLALLGRASHLSLYYSAPMLGTIWIFAADSLLRQPVRTRRAWTAYWIAATLLIGSGSAEFWIPSSLAQAIRADTRQKLPCLLPLPLHQGWVSARLFRELPESAFEKVLTERPPSATVDGLSFAWLVPGTDDATTEAWRAKLNQDPAWVVLDGQCRITSVNASETTVLFVKKAIVTRQR